MFTLYCKIAVMTQQEAKIIPCHFDCWVNKDPIPAATPAQNKSINNEIE